MNLRQQRRWLSADFRSNLLVGISFVSLLLISIGNNASASKFEDVIDRVKPSIVGVGSYKRVRSPAPVLVGTGFVVGDGYHVITNDHVATETLSDEKGEELVVFVGQGRSASRRTARVIKRDVEHDLALLRINGAPLTPMQLPKHSEVLVREGSQVAFTGFPIGIVLGLYPVTHRGYISSVTPIVIPAVNSSKLDTKSIKRLRDPYFVYQLDATAYPGNSGSPLYDPSNGTLIGVINKVFVKETKESILSKPSGITYAIPARYVVRLMSK